MGYFMRYFVTDAEPVTLDRLAAALTAHDPAYVLVRDPQLENFAELRHGQTRLADIELDAPDDDMLLEDVDELRGLLAYATGEAKARVIATLDHLRGAVVVEAYWDGDNPEPTFQKLDPLWDWLFAEVAGLLQTDGEGFWDQNGLIVPVRVRI